MAVKLPIYMDHNATTPLDPRVFEAMRPYFMEIFGNAASRAHSFGWEAEAAVDKARQQVAALLNARPDAIVWTSGATESNNLALKGVAEAHRHRGRHIITQVTEHKAVLDTCKRLQKWGYEVTYLGVDRFGRIDLDELRDAIRADTILVSIMWANNEIGTIQPIRQIGQICREKGVLFHTDATQAVGKVPIDVVADNVDLLSLSGHKFYGPKGCGCLYVRNKPQRIELAAHMDGGGHERGYRSGTINVPGVVGVGAACEIAMKEMASEMARLRRLRDRLQAGIIEQVDGVQVNGYEPDRLPHMTNLSFAGVDHDELLLAMSDIAVSSGSACTSASLEPSYVLRALGVPSALAFSSLRFSLGRRNTEEEVDFVIDRLSCTVGKLRGKAKFRLE
ncbi:IscS subfamily cysteine desulfurase [Fontivita pretiosa]|uniref:IscS subfamily cysteine desulfurase n=1 Tax=Fontivita pretiosa TaxID=2989684 RepID=UPI003D17792D